MPPRACPEPSRRAFLYQAGGAAAVTAAGMVWLGTQGQGSRHYFLRPPRAVAEAQFRQRCIGCAKCFEACQNGCIHMLGPEVGLTHLRTPAIFPRRRGCTLCMACVSVCPTGALAPLAAGTPMARAAVHMGVAELKRGICFSYNGRTCGVCYKACPLPGKAMTVGLYEQPTVHPEACVGCGLCEQACLHLPQAIRVRDRERFG